jgi:SAM-dependent methyltransferase
MAARKYDYLLGDGRREAARLQRQAALWDPTTHALFDRLGVSRGMRVLEVGPGRGSLHMELRRRVRGPVDAVERSAAFVSALRKRVARDGLGEGNVWQCDLLDAPLPANTYDLVFARWVFLFLPDPRAHLKKLVRALKPGGRIAIQDYLRRTLSLVPEPPEWDALARADLAFFATQGGDANIGARLPTLYREVGLTVQEVEPTMHFGHPGSPAWRWMTDYFLGVMDRLARETGAKSGLTKENAKRLRKQWQAAGRERTSFVLGPTVLDVVGRKKR